jgi:hypothetical protein
MIELAVTNHFRLRLPTGETIMTRLFGCFLLLMLPLTVHAQDDAAMTSKSRVVSISVTILEITGHLQVQDPKDINVERLQKAVSDASQSGILRHLTRIRVSTVEQLPAQIQFGQTRALPSSKSIMPGRGDTDRRVAVSYRQEETGTILEATPRIAGKDEVLLQLKIEQTRLAPASAAASDDEGLMPRSNISLQLGTTVKIPSGRTVLVSGGQKLDAESEPLQTYVMVGAEVLD